MRLQLWVVILVSATAIPVPAAPLSLSAAVDEAIQSHPLIAAGRANVEASQGLERQAGLRAFNPKLILQSENTRLPGDNPYTYWEATDSFAYLQQTVETGGRRGKRTALAAADVHREELTLELLRRQIARDVRLAYWAAVAARRRVEILSEAVTNFEQIVSYHQIRVREGAMAEADLIRVQLERERILILRNQAEFDAARAEILLQREMGRTVIEDIELAEGLGPVEPPAASPDPEGAVAKRTEVEITRQDEERARLRLSLEQVQPTPNVDVFGGLKRTNGFNTLIAGLQVDLPVLNRNQGNIAWATHVMRAAESTTKAQEAIIRAEVQAAWQEVLLRRRQVESLLPVLEERARESSDIARAAYREGGADLLRLLDAERVRLEVQQTHAQLLGDYRQAVVRFEYAMGAGQ